MKKLWCLMLALVCAFSMAACSSEEEIPEEETDASQTEESTEQEEQPESAEDNDDIGYTVNGTEFWYNGNTYDLTEYDDMINAITEVTPVQHLLVLNCHISPKIGIYAIYDTVNQKFVDYLPGTNLIWYDDDFETAYYAFWSEIHNHDGITVKSYKLGDETFITDMAFSEDHSQLLVTLTDPDGEETNDVVEISDLALED